MNISRILFLIIFLFASSSLLTMSLVLNEIGTSPLNIVETPLEELSRKKLELQGKYQQELIDLLENYNFNEKGKQPLEDELLSLTVPAKYQDLHFKLITSIDGLEDNSDKGLKNLPSSFESLINEYSWLSSTLSFFIINNF